VYNPPKEGQQKLVWGKGMAAIVNLFCDIDDFCKEFEPKWKPNDLISGAVFLRPFDYFVYARYGHELMG